MEENTNLEEMKGNDLFEKLTITTRKVLVILKNPEIIEQLGSLESEMRAEEREVLRRFNLLDTLLAGDGEGEFGHLTDDQLFKEYDEQMAIAVEYKEPAHTASRQKRDHAISEAAKLQLEIRRRIAKGKIVPAS